MSTTIRPACPQCLLNTVRRSRPRFYDLPFKAFGLRAGRCTACGHRFYRAPSELASYRPGVSIPPQSVPPELASSEISTRIA